MIASVDSRKLGLDELQLKSQELDPLASSIRIPTFAGHEDINSSGLQERDRLTSSDLVPIAGGRSPVGAPEKPTPAGRDEVELLQKVADGSREGQNKEIESQILHSVIV